LEEKRPNTFFPVDQDRRGTYIYNSRDLCLIDRLDEIVDAGVDGIKIEGRMKTENYVSSVTWAYRQALDLIKRGKYNNAKKASLLKELDKTTHRTFTSGFMFNNSKKSSPELADNDNVGYIKKYRFAGSVTGFSEQYDGPVILARNQVKINDILDILQPGKNPVKFKLVKMVNAKSGQPADVCNTNDSFIICGLGKINDMSLVKVKL
jgi:putative protease